MLNKQDPRYFQYSSFPKRQCAVTGDTTSGVASFLTTSSNLITLNASPTVPVVVTWANGFDPFPVDYAYKWTSNATNAWGTFAAGTHYLYIDYDPSTDTVSYGSTTVVPNDDLIPPSHGAGVHWFDQTKYKMYESVAGVWTERIRMFPGEAISNGSSVTTLITYALNGRWYSGEKTVQALNTVAAYSHNIGSDKLKTEAKLRCKISENLAVAGLDYDYLEMAANAATERYTKATNFNRLSFNHRRGENSTVLFAVTSPTAPFVQTSTNFRYIFSAERSY